MKVLIPEESKASNIIELSLKDKRILTILAANCRIPVSRIADLTGMSRHLADYRIKSFFSKNLIVGSRTMISLKKLGYHTYHVFLELASLDDEKKLIAKALNMKSINLCITYSGKYSVEVSFVVRTPEEYLEEIDDLIKDINILSYSLNIIIRTVKSEVLPENITVRQEQISKRNDSSFFKDFSKKRLEDIRYDKVDLQILKMLSDNANESTKYIAEKLRLSPETVTSRIQKLIRSGTIVQFRPVINYSCLGVHVHCLLFSMIFKGAEEERLFNNFISQKSQVLWCAKTIGSYNYILYVTTSSLDEVHRLLSQIKKEFWQSMKGHETLYAYKEFKYSYFSENVTL